MKLYIQLENLFKVRFNSNENIIPTIKKLSEMGKFDEPKKVAVLAIILDRLGEQENEALIQESLKADEIAEIAVNREKPDSELIGGNGSDGIGNDETISDIP